MTTGLKTRRPTVSHLRALITGVFVGTDARFTLSAMPGGKVRINTDTERTLDILIDVLDEFGYRIAMAGQKSVIVT